MALNPVNIGVISTQYLIT